MANKPEETARAMKAFERGFSVAQANTKDIITGVMEGISRYASEVTDGRPAKCKVTIPEALEDELFKDMVYRAILENLIGKYFTIFMEDSE